MKNNQSVTLERIFDAPPEKIWQALSDNSQMKRWYFDLPDFRPEVGFQFQFKGGPAPERQYTHLCEVVEVIAGQKIAYTWRYEGYAGDSLVTSSSTSSRMPSANSTSPTTNGGGCARTTT